MAETGLSLVVSKEMLSNLQKADALITNLATKSEQAKNRIVSAFTEMGDKGVGAFIRKLNETQKALTGLDSVMGNIKGNNLATIGTQASNSIDDINKLIQALSRLNDSQTNNIIAQATAADYKKLANTIKEVKVVEDERNRELTRKNKENIASNKIYAAQLKTNTDIAIAKEKERQIQIKRSLDELKRLAKAYKAMPKNISTKQVGNLVAGSVQATSINQRIVAISNLQNAIKDLDTTDKRYNSTLNKLNHEIERQKQELGKLGVNISNVKKGHKGLLDISGQLQRRLALVFSLSQVTGYIQKLIQVRGEFELQQRSLQSILQNKDEANKLWQQTIDLAIRSPFRVKELVTYTKQLAAYRVETEKLYDTTKMLADISAGLGVDMQRLILAFGQVKAANYLRGTELRQFSEAGVNILGELAKYFSELENRAVSVGDVFERVSKRMVTFSDVEAIFKRLTSEGGTFYRMQEIQSETLKGLISNLKDSIDLMLNEIGASNEGTLKSMVGLVKSLVDNWRFFAATLKQVSIIMAGIGVAKFVSGWKLVAAQGVAASLAMNGMAGAGARLNVALATIGKTINRHPIFLFVAALASIGHYFFEYIKTIRDTNSAYDEMSDRIYRSRDALNELNIKVQDNNKSIKEYADLMAKNDSSTKGYESAKKSLNNAEKTSSLLYDELKRKYPDIIKYVKKQKDGIIDLTEAVTLYNRMVTTQIALNEQAKGGIGYESAKKNYEDLLDRQAQINSLVTKVKSTTASAITQLDRFKNELPKDVFSKIYELANNVLNASSDNIIDVRVDLMRYLQTIKDEVPNATEIINAFVGSWRKFDVYKLSMQLGRYTGDWENFVANLKNMKPAFEDAIRGLKFETGEDKAIAGSLFNALLDNLGIFDDKVRKATQDWLELELALQGKIDWSSKGFVSAIDDETINNEEELSSLLSDRISVIKELNSSYKELNKTFNETESKEKVMDSYLNTVNSLFNELGITIKDIDFTTIDGVISALKMLLPTVQEGTKDWIRLNKAISEFNIQRDVDLRISENKSIIEQIEDMFSGYELYIELQKLNIPQDLAKNLFNIDTLTLPELKDSILKLKPEFEGKDMLEEWNKLLKRIDDMEIKAQQERLKTYSKYLVKAQNERVKLKLEELRQLAEVESEGRYSQDQKKQIQDAIRKETKEKLSKQEWAEFTESDMYIQMFEDLEYLGDKAIANLKDKLEQLKTSLKDLPASDVKEIITQIEKLESIQIKRSPFEAYRKTLSEIRKLEKGGESEEQLQSKTIALYEANELAQSELDVINTIIGAREQGNTQLLYQGEFLQQNAELLGKTNDELISERDNLQKVIKANNNEVKSVKKKLKLYTDNREALQAMANEYSKIEEYGNKAFSGITSMLESIGVESDSVAMSLVDAGQQSFNLILSIIQMQIQFKAMGIAANSALGIIGWMAMALQGIAILFSTIFGMKDKRLEKQIERETKLVENLEKTYKNLEKAIENAYSINTFESANDMAQSNLKARIAATERMIKLEEDKKKTDKDRIEEWKDDIAEMRELLRELDIERIQELGGFGSGDAYKSAAQEFVSAWMDAYKEAGDGLSGLNEQFQEFFEDMVAKQVIMRGVEKFLSPFYEQFDAMFGEGSLGGGLATKQELDAIKEMWDKTSPQLSEFLSGLMDSLGVAGDLAESTGELSGLQRGIQGITEEQADVIAAYLNSMRFFISDSNTKLTMLVNSFTNSETPNPILSELRTQSEMIRAIRDMFDSVIGRGGSTHSGAYLKVAL